METQKLVKLIFKDWMKVKYFLGKAPNELFLDFKKRFNAVCIQLILLVAYDVVLIISSVEKYNHIFLNDFPKSSYSFI